MPRISRFIIAESRIKNYFLQEGRNAFSNNQINIILEKFRKEWNLPQGMYTNTFISKLTERNILKCINLEFEGYLPNKVRYITNNTSEFNVAASLIPKSYLSHYTALFLNGLTTQIPKTIYVTFEQSKKLIVNPHLEQKSIDSAFAKQQRKSGTTTKFNDYTILLLNGKNTNRAGVYMLNEIPITNLERTLIDVTVRPAYAGGVHSVLDAHKRSLENISINKLSAILENIKFIYPYHQSIGFYLEKAGVESQKLNVFRKKEMPNDFYLTYGMKEKEYSKDWKLYYPKGL